MYTVLRGVVQAGASSLWSSLHFIRGTWCIWGLKLNWLNVTGLAQELPFYTGYSEVQVFAALDRCDFFLFFWGLWFVFFLFSLVSLLLCWVFFTLFFFSSLLWTDSQTKPHLWAFHLALLLQQPATPHLSLASCTVYRGTCYMAMPSEFFCVILHSCCSWNWKSLFLSLVLDQPIIQIGTDLSLSQYDYPLHISQRVVIVLTCKCTSTNCKCTCKYRFTWPAFYHYLSTWDDCILHLLINHKLS